MEEPAPVEEELKPLPEKIEEKPEEHVQLNEAPVALAEPIQEMTYVDNEEQWKDDHDAVDELLGRGEVSVATE